MDSGPKEEVKVERDEAPAASVSEITTYEKGMIALDNLKTLNIDPEFTDPTEARARLRAVITTLVKVIGNILSSPMEPKFRKLPKQAGSVKQKILGYPHAVAFLKVADFRFESNPDYIEYTEMDKDRLEECKRALLSYVEKMGGSVQDPNAFNPFQAGISSTTGEGPLPGGSGSAVASGLAKTKGVQDKIREIQEKREAELEGKIEDREVKIYINQGRTQGIPALSAQEAQQ